MEIDEKAFAWAMSCAPKTLKRYDAIHLIGNYLECFTAPSDGADDGGPHGMASGHHALPLGLYLITWKDGSTSEAAIGMSASGDRWLAPTNWVRPTTNPAAVEWYEIERADRLPPLAPPSAQPSKELMEAAGELDRRLLEFITYIEDDSEVNRYDELVTPAQVKLRTALSQPPVTGAELRRCQMEAMQVENARRARTEATADKPLPSSEGDEA